MNYNHLKIIRTMKKLDIVGLKTLKKFQIVLSK